MKKSIKELYIVEIMMLLTFLIFKLIINQYFLEFSKYFDIIYYFIFFIYFYIRYGKPRNKNYLNKICLRYMIIAILTYILVIYLLGLFTGFVKSVYSLKAIDILKNISPIIVCILIKEYIRFCVAFNSKKKIYPLIIITVIYIIMDLLEQALATNLNDGYHLFVFISTIVLPTIADHALSSYIVYNIGILPSLLYNITFKIAYFVLPIYPDLGNYLNAILGILFPFLLFLIFRKWIHYHDKESIKLGRSILKLIGIPLIIFSTILAILISGIFKYQLIAIGSDSMNPIYYRGDAVIYEKKEATEVKEGDILVFKKRNATITHRVVKIIDKGNTLAFQTKGDNNDDLDLDVVNSSEVLGTVKYVVKYLGYPTLWFNDTF